MALLGCQKGSQGSLRYDETVNIMQANALEDQKLLFGGRQLEDGSSPARSMKALETHRETIRNPEQQVI